MGPYCNFCQRRCFVPFPGDTPVHILRAFGSATILATCSGGKQHERDHVGFCLDDITEYQTRVPVTGS